MSIVKIENVRVLDPIQKQTTYKLYIFKMASWLLNQSKLNKPLMVKANG